VEATVEEVTVEEVTVEEVTGAQAGAVLPSISAEVECIWAEAECMPAVARECALSAAVDAAFGTAVGTPTESARVGG
jgi:hypothetical protein